MVFRGKDMVSNPLQYRARIAAGLALALAAPFAVATPDIGAVFGDIVDGGAVTITGTGFGATGPSLVVFDDFDDGSAVDDDVDLTPTAGFWTEHGPDAQPRPPFYDATALSGDRSARVVDGSDNEDGQQRAPRFIKVNFPETTEFFLSYWMQVPAGKAFPGMSQVEVLPTPATVAGNSSVWKAVGIFDGKDATTDNDYYLPSYVAGEFELIGNNSRLVSKIQLVDPSAAAVDQSTDIFEFGIWGRVTVWMRAPASTIPEVYGAGDTFFQWFKEGTGVPNGRRNVPEPESFGPTFPGGVWHEPRVQFDQPMEFFTDVQPVFSGPVDAPVEVTGGPPVDKPPFRWTHMNFTSFADNGVARTEWDDVSVVFDDVYLATGAGAMAHIEICNAPTRSLCTKAGMITVDVGDGEAWSDTSITGTIRAGGLSPSELRTAYVYVWDSEGLVNSSGFELCPECPEPPQSLTVE